MTESLFSSVHNLKCPLCGGTGPTSIFDVHHIWYDPEITIRICVSCHVQITRLHLSPEEQMQLDWQSKALKLIMVAYQRKISKLKTQITELEKLKLEIKKEIPLKECIVREPKTKEEKRKLIEQGFMPVGNNVGGHIDDVFYKRPVCIPWRLQ